MYEMINGTMIIISHQERILNIADRVIVIKDGKIEKDGNKEEILPGLLTSDACSVLTDKLSK
jgi:Fe-S cluster assembly ATP-binding protein